MSMGLKPSLAEQVPLNSDRDEPKVVLHKKHNSALEIGLNVTDSSLPLCRNSCLAILLFGLVLFNLAFTFRGLLFSRQGSTTPKLCPSFSNNILQETNPEIINVVFFGKYAYKNMKIIRGIDRTIGSILENTESILHLHVLIDLPSKERIGRVFKKLSSQHHRKMNVTYYNVAEMSQNFKSPISTLKKLFFTKDVGRYNDDIFFMSEILHLALPEYLNKVIFLDIDLSFVADIKVLYDEFRKFSSSNIIGLAPDLQPQYREDFAKYRAQHPNTSVGSARPGKQGFNTGVILLHLERMRESPLYESLLNDVVLEKLCDKYQFKGYLGHQDFFTLTGMEFPELYYNLDCSWNRQLDIGWLQSVERSVFDSYHSCETPVRVFHGNGDAYIPDRPNKKN